MHRHAHGRVWNLLTELLGGSDARNKEEPALVAMTCAQNLHARFLSVATRHNRTTRGGVPNVAAGPVKISRASQLSARRRACVCGEGGQVEHGNGGGRCLPAAPWRGCTEQGGCSDTGSHVLQSRRPVVKR